jgi:hypothetical protein
VIYIRGEVRSSGMGWDGMGWDGNSDRGPFPAGLATGARRSVPFAPVLPIVQPVKLHHSIIKAFNRWVDPATEKSEATVSS